MGLISKEEPAEATLTGCRDKGCDKEERGGRVGPASQVPSHRVLGLL